MKRHKGLTGKVLSVEVPCTLPMESGVTFSGNINVLTIQEDHQALVLLPIELLNLWLNLILSPLPTLEVRGWADNQRTQRKLPL